MFRLLKLKPPHGWNAVAWELAICASIDTPSEDANKKVVIPLPL